jgi:opacity protein-like surface antigen
MTTSLRGLRVAALFATIAFMTARSAAAQMGVPERHLFRVGFGGGVSVPTSDVRDALENGINGQAFVLIDTGVLPPFRVNLGYQKFDYRDVLGSGVQGNTRILSGVAAVNLSLFTVGPLRPYVVAGIGAFGVRDAIGAGTTGPAVSESVTEFGIDGGAGLAFRLGRLEAFVEGRVQNIYTEAGAIDARSIRAIPVTLGILF